MEDILASIRRILSEDDQAEVAPAPAAAAPPPKPAAPPPAAKAAAPPPPPEPEPEPEPEQEEEEQIDLAEVMRNMRTRPEPEPEPEPEIEFEDIEPEPEPEPELEPEPEPEPEPEYEPEPFVPPPPPPRREPRTFAEDILELTQQMIAQPLRDVGAGSPILSPPAQQHSTDALQELARALLNKRDIAIGNRDMTLEGLIREILRPLLREWLDQNLPYLIERLVKKEIDHMVNRAERLDL